MKTIFFITSAVLATILFSACKQGSNLTDNMPMRTNAGSGSSTAHPAITYVSGTTLKKIFYNTIAVMDTDGTHQTNVYTASSSSETDMNPTWSPSGGSIAWKTISSAVSSSILTAEISVNSSGTPVASNQRTVYSPSSSDSLSIITPAWCTSSATAKIAFVRQYIGTNLGKSELCTISESGGSVTVLASYSKKNSAGTVISHYTYPTWSPDDSKIAVIREDTIGHNTIMIFDASTGAALDSIPISGGVSELEWSRTGMNKLVYIYTPNSSTAWSLYYADPTTGSTPSTNSVTGGAPTWSPNNSSIMYVNSSLMKVIPLTATTTTVSSSGPGNKMNWKK
ncbi:MAG: hypothetical protein Q8916_06095 [Bacteroidota bacterium]|nr:hypothetical protein [Bacteroidota bacterium]MDP4229960.1 hypothetical protein [Bacteroidota bacterium]MDP4235667.1 hypothetical protein [Bacteroidota bacterium]